MLDWFVERIEALINSVPPLLVSGDTPNFMPGRTMLGLLLIVLMVYIIAMVPFRSLISQCSDKLTDLAARRK
jgi:hypothetical protein